MKVIHGEAYYTISEMAHFLNVTISTIRNWEEYERDLGYNVLPQPRRDLDKKGTRFYTYDAVSKFEEFRNNVEYGALAKISRRKWGKRGSQI